MLRSRIVETGTSQTGCVAVRVRPLTWLAALGALAATFGLEGQTFQRTLGGIYDDRPYCVEHTNDNGYIICGDQSIVERI